MFREIATPVERSSASNEPPIKPDNLALLEQAVPTVSVSATPLTYSVPQAATLLGINRNTAYELVACGEIPSIRLGRRVLVVRAEFERWLANGGTRRT